MTDKNLLIADNVNSSKVTINYPAYTCKVHGEITEEIVDINFINFNKVYCIRCAADMFEKSGVENLKIA